MLWAGIAYWDVILLMQVGEIREHELHGLPQDLEETRQAIAEPLQSVLYCPLAQPILGTR
jgi:hypothetical protein